LTLKNKRSAFWLAVLLAVILLVALYPFWLRAFGGFLVKADSPEASAAAVVLAGDVNGRRIRKAVELMRAKYVPLIVVSGPCCIYGRNEGEMAVDLAVREGAPREWFTVVANEARSTVEEAAVIAAFLRKRGISDFLLVTSDYHTRRAGGIYRGAAPDLSFRVIAAPDRNFQADRWWHSREGQKVFLGEWERTVAHWLGI
jgi:uncharacterized SAM-binding protein YcdF (DUF218 family)